MPAPEANHAIAAAVREAKKPENDGKVILFNLCGHGHFDMTAWQAYTQGNLKDYDYPESEVAMALAGIPPVPDN